MWLVALIREYFPLRQVEQLSSGDQIVQTDGRWDRVHGVGQHDEYGVLVPGVVFVRTDIHSSKWLRFAEGTLVKVV
jgi:hypothetical protein